MSLDMFLARPTSLIVELPDDLGVSVAARVQDAPVTAVRHIVKATTSTSGAKQPDVGPVVITGTSSTLVLYHQDWPSGPDGSVGGEDGQTARTAGLEWNRRGISGRVILRLPNEIPRSLVQRYNRCAAPAGRDNDAIAIHQRRFAVTPSWDAAAKLLADIVSPNTLAGSRFQAQQHAVAGQGIQAIPLDCRRAAGAVALVVAVGAAGRRLQSGLPVLTSIARTNC